MTTTPTIQERIDANQRQIEAARLALDDLRLATLDGASKAQAAAAAKLEAQLVELRQTGDRLDAAARAQALQARANDKAAAQAVLDQARSATVTALEQHAEAASEADAALAAFAVALRKLDAAAAEARASSWRVAEAARPGSLDAQQAVANRVAGAVDGVLAAVCSELIVALEGTSLQFRVIVPGIQQQPTGADEAARNLLEQSIRVMKHLRVEKTYLPVDSADPAVRWTVLPRAA